MIVVSLYAAFAIYCGDTDRCYFTHTTELDGRSRLQLRLGKTRNNQRSRINWARDFEFGAKLKASLGP